MFFNAVKATLLMSAVGLVSSAVTSQPGSVPFVKRHFRRRPNHDCTFPNKACQQFSGDTDLDGYGPNPYQDLNLYDGGVLANSGATVNTDVVTNGGVTTFDTMVRAWTSLTASFQEFQRTVSAGASIEVVVQVAIKLSVQVRTVSSQYSTCGCSPSSQTHSEFQSMAVQFFISVQSAVQVCHQRFAYAWETHFRSVFEQFSVAFVSLKTIATSIQVDLAAVLGNAGINVQLFATVGLDLSVLLQLNLSLGGLLGGRLFSRNTKLLM